MVQVLPAVPSFGESLVNSIANAAGKIGAGYVQRAEKIKANSPQAQKALYSIFKQYKAQDAYTDEYRKRAEDRAQEYIKQGYEPYQAAISAYDDMLAGFPEKAAKGKGKEKGKEASNLPTEQQQAAAIQGKTPLQAIQDIANTPAEKVLRPGYKFLHSPLQSLIATPLEKIKEWGKQKNAELVAENEALKAAESKKAPGLPKPAAELSYKDILELPAEAITSLPLEEQRIIGQKIAEGAKLATDIAFASGIDPTGIIQGSERALQAKGISPNAPINEASQAPLGVSNLAGTILKDYLLFQGAGAARTLPGKLAAGAGIFGGEKALKTAIGEGRSPTVGEIAGASAFGAGGELLGPILNASKKFISQVPKAYNAIKSAVGDIGKGAEAVKGAEAAKGAVTEDKIIKEAVKNLEKRGVSVVKAAEGDTKALNEIQKESIKVADTFKEAEKYNRKELEKVRGEKAEKLVQSPLEEYYAPAKEVKHRPETIAKEAERIKPLELSIKQNERRLQNLQYQILSAEKDLLENAHKYSAAERDRIRALIDQNKMSHAKALNEIRAANFEIKYKRPPATTEQIQEQIGKSFDEIRAGIKDPTIDKIKKLEKALEQNKAAVEQAEKLVARGELPGPQVFDEYIKIKQEYVKAYGDLIEELKAFVRDNKNVKEKAAEVANAKKLIGLIEQTRNQARSSIINQIDKRKAMKTLEGPSGALWKNMLKEVRKDVEAFQKDWVKANKLITPEQAKTAQAAQKSLPKAQTEAKQLGAAEEAVKKAQEPLKDIVEEIGKKMNEGKATEKTASMLEAALKKYAAQLTRFSKTVPQRLLRGAFLGTLQGLFEEYTGVRPPLGILGAIVPGGAGARSATYGASAWAHNLVNNIFVEKEAKILRSKQNTPEFNTYLSELKQRYDDKRVNKILKAVRQSKK